MNFFLKQKCDFNNPVVSMGTFDGVHLGHQALLRHLVARSKQISGEAVIITYYHHPLETIHNKTFPYLLTERDKKENLLKSFGVDCVLYLNFNEKMSQMSPRSFIEEIITGEVNARELIVGHDTHFGKDRVGNHQLLQEIAADRDLNIDIFPPVKIGNRIVSSSIIRDFVREGNMEQVKKHLGRSYSISGIVKTGHKIGRGLGFPTINIRPSDNNKLIPALGVYLCEIMIERDHYFGLTNVGYSPTIKNTGILEVETHLIDFSGDLYGKEVEVYFNRKLRDELLFESKEELINEINNDMTAARKYFNI